MSEQKPPVDFERTDVEPSSIVRAAIGVAIVSLAAILAVLLLLNFFGRRATQAEPPNPPLARHEQGRLPPAPRLQEQPFLDLQTLHGEEQKVLTSAAWVDEGAGIARIPIDEAIKIVAEKGLPYWPPAPSPVPGTAPASPAPTGGAR